MELPRANQPATAELIVANPAGINDALLNLISRPAAIKIGIKDQSTGNFSFREVSDWWVATAKRELDGNINRIKMTFGNIWERLKNPLRDTYNLIGQTIWEDWQIGARDKAFNYFFLSDSAPVENLDGSLSSKGVALYTGWKGHNCRFSVDFASLADASKSSVIIFRYIDSRNYYQVGVGSIGANGLILSRTVNGVTTTLATGTMPSVAARLQIDVRWRRYVISTDDVVRITHFETNPGSKPGYVGVGGVSWKISKLKLEDFEYPLTTEDLIRSALALGDYHTVSVGGATSRQMAITWGPQTDLTNAAEVLLRLFEEDKLEMIWREGRIEIGKFMSTSPIRTLQDQIIETDYIEEGYDRINLSMVDGNEHTWIEVDAVDTQDRDRQLNGYFDIPELLDQSAVTARAQEEIRRSKMGKSPGALIPFQFDLYRMDPVTLVDNNGVSNLVRIEGFEIEIQQNEKPTQHQRLDTSLLT